MLSIKENYKKSRKVVQILYIYWLNNKDYLYSGLFTLWKIIFLSINFFAI